MRCCNIVPNFGLIRRSENDILHLGKTGVIQYPTCILQEYSLLKFIGRRTLSLFQTQLHVHSVGIKTSLNYKSFVNISVLYTQNRKTMLFY